MRENPCLVSLGPKHHVPSSVRNNGHTPSRHCGPYLTRRHSAPELKNAALLVRFNPVWCTLASSVHQAASTRPVRERWRGHDECSVSTFYSAYHEQDTFISIRATTARSYHHSLTDVTRDAHSTVSELSTRQTKRASKRKGTARKFTTRKHQSRPGSPAAAQGVARGPVAGRQW